MFALCIRASEVPLKQLLRVLFPTTALQCKWRFQRGFSQRRIKNSVLLALNVGNVPLHRVTAALLRLPEYPTVTCSVEKTAESSASIVE